MTERRATMKGIPGDAARRRGIRRVLIPLLCFGVLFGLGLGVCAGAVGLLPAMAGVVLLVLAVVGLTVYCRRQPALVYGYFKGARGEEMVAGELARLGSEWTVFNGLLLPDGQDIDHVAVGPQGLFVIETKHWSGSVTVEGGEVLANGRPLRRSPVVQVRRSMGAVSAVAAVPEGTLHGVLCFAGRQLPEGAARADEVLVCSHLGLVDALTSGPIVFDAAALARMVARLGAFTVTEGL